MPGCVIKWCRSHTRLKCPGITFHYFPTDPIRKNKWIAAVKLERQDNDWMPVKSSRVCSIHFEEKDFYKLKYNMLHKTAVPVCTMIRPEETSKSIRDTTENEKIKNSQRLELDNENSPFANFEDCDLPELLNKTNTADPQAHKAQKRKLGNNNDPDPECNDGVEEEPRKIKFKNNLVSTEVHNFEERGPCVTLLNITSSDIESTLNTPIIQSLTEKLRKKTILAAKRLSQIRNLKRRNKRLAMKNISLKTNLAQFKKLIMSSKNNQ